MEPHERAARLAREAQGYFDLELWPEALQRLDALRDLGSFPETVPPLRAECLRNLGRFAEAVPVYESILAESPEETGAWVGLGWCRKRMGRLDLAVAAMERLIAARPEEAIGPYNLACYLSLAGERKRAIEALARAAGMDEDYRRLAREEPDFDPVRDDPDFRRVTREES